MAEPDYAGDRIVPPLLEKGWRGFRLKTGFGAEADREGLLRLRGLVGREADVMADSNQRWTLSETLEMAPRLRETNLAWMEAPLPADAGDADWREVADKLGVAVAAGENLRGEAAFALALACCVRVPQLAVLSKEVGLRQGRRTAPRRGTSA